MGSSAGTAAAKRVAPASDPQHLLAVNKVDLIWTATLIVGMILFVYLCSTDDDDFAL